MKGFPFSFPSLVFLEEVAMEEERVVEEAEVAMEEERVVDGWSIILTIGGIVDVSSASSQTDNA